MILIEREANQELVETFKKANTHPLLAKLFVSRGMMNVADISLELKNLMPPDQLKGCQDAAKFLVDAIVAKSPILIVADYDCDGATACAVGVLGLNTLGQQFNTQVDFLVPNRFTMGYGLTPEVVELAASRSPRPQILITVDNGIASINGVNAANELGMDVVVTDHHLPADDLPAATHIVNPNQPGCAFPSKALAGVGVMFYLLLAIRSEMRARGFFSLENQPKLEPLLDLVALGTVADVASLDRNNRILVNAGLKKMRQGNASPGIKALFEASGRDINKANAFDLGFGVGPRLNAAGRLADMTLGIRCLLSAQYPQAQQLAQELDRMNRERRHIETGMQETALDNLAEINISNLHGLTLVDPTWHQGVIGILASRLKDKYHLPVFVFAHAEELDHQGQVILKGSGRSISGFHLRDALDLISKKYPDLILKFGGHSMAAGLSISSSEFEQFKSAFEEVASSWLDEDALSRRLIHDGELEATQITPETARILSDEIWGQGFPEPIFTGNFKIIKQTVLKDKHLKLELVPLNSASPASQTLLGIWFNHADPLPQEICLAYRLLLDEFLAYPRAQLNIQSAYPLHSNDS
ncbi:MAG: single-stranded-DNA-specific exonuclease RecJ [Betaproteobacteria bacterium]